MAVAYQSVQTSVTGTTDITIDKPASLAVGDLMIAVIGKKTNGSHSLTPSTIHTVEADEEIIPAPSCPMRLYPTVLGLILIQDHKAVSSLACEIKRTVCILSS